MSKLFVSQKVPSEYIRSVFQDIVRGIEEFINVRLPIRNTGTFTMAAAATKTVTDINVRTTSTILLMPTNDDAATLMGSSEALYISARTSGASFAVATADGGDASGTETFQYIILN